MTKNGNFCIVLQCVGTNSGWFLTETHRVKLVRDPVGLVVHTSALQPIGRLYWENSGLSEIVTQILGNVNIHGFGGCIRHPCH